MFHGKRVIAITPAGRQPYLEILSKYVFREAAIIDEWHLWLNTDCPSDSSYIKALGEHPIVSVLEHPSIPSGFPKIQHFWPYLRDEDTVYLRLDDDIVFIDRDSIAQLLRFSLCNPEFLLVFPNIVNNAVCSYAHQFCGGLPAEPKTGPRCTDAIGWKCPKFAELVHQEFFSAYKRGTLRQFWFGQIHLQDRFSINSFVMSGSIGAQLEHDYSKGEEPWVTEFETKRLRRRNCVFGQALMVHFAFYTQRPYLEARPWILEEYRRIAEIECR